MKSSISPDRRSLLNPILISEDRIPEAAEIIISADNPIFALQLRGLTKDNDFFPNLAFALNLKFVAKLDLPLQSEKNISLKIPPKLLIRYLVYIYEDQGGLFAACANPYLAEEIWSEILLYTGKPNFTLVICHPQEILNALSHVFRTDLSITSTEMVHCLHQDKSTKTYTTLIVPKLFPIGFFLIFALCLILNPYATTGAVFVVLNLFYFLVNPYKYYAIIKSLHSTKSLFITDEMIRNINPDRWPPYTILIPLRHEVNMVPELIQSLNLLDYPREKLDIKFICEVDDRPTIEALEKYGIGVTTPHLGRGSFNTQLIKVPQSDIATKPRACDYGLQFAKGLFTVIYDAEDRPDRDQLKKAYAAFLQAPLTTVCIQAKLNFYNSRQNLLTRFFSIEYGFWYEYYLEGLEEIGSPIPLGGTSNHFITSSLVKLGTWDPYNVTEDADIGLRIFRYRYRTSIINSYTREEANSQIPAWIRQRTRWQKGFLLTFLVHTSRPLLLIRELGVRKTLLTLMTYGGNFFMPLFNPFLWVLFIFGFTPVKSIIHLPPLPDWVLIIGVFNLVVGNITYMAIHFVAALRGRRYDLAPLTLFLPVYWMLLSVATLRAAYQFIRKPYYWEKTKHGVSVKMS